MVALLADELLSDAYLAERSPFGEMDFAELAAAPIEALAGLSASDAERLKRALGIRTIGDLGRHPAIVAAVAIAALSDPRDTPAHDHIPLSARLAVTRASISRGRVFPSATGSIEQLREERLAPW